jgi:excisionase family DNA binding protein
VTADDPVLFIDEVAAELRVHPNTIRRHIKAHRLVATKQGNRWFIRRSAVDAFTAAGWAVAA